MVKILAGLLVVLLATSCSSILTTTNTFASSFSSPETINATVTPKPTQPEEVKTETLIPTEVELEEPKRISLEGLYTVSIQSEFLTDWYRSLFKQLEIRWCEQCSSEEIETQLEYAGNNWIAVQDEHVLYIHSGWDFFAGPELGEILLRMYKAENLIDSVICLNENVCYEVVDYKILERDSIGGSISLGELFTVQEDDYFIFTCSELVIPGIPTPKLVIQIRQLE